MAHIHPGHRRTPVVLHQDPRPGPTLALQNKRAINGILFHAVAETLLEVAKDIRLLGGEIGFLAVLHAWGQNLQHQQSYWIIGGSGIFHQFGSAMVRNRLWCWCVL